MDLREALAQTATKKGPTAAICKFVATLDPKQRAQFDDACANRDIETAHLTRALSEMAGKKFDAQAVGKHRKGGCVHCGT